MADPQLQLEPLLNGSELHITPRAGLLLSSRPVAGRPKLIASLVESNLLLLARTAPLEWRNMGAPRAVRDEQPDGPPPNAPNVLHLGDRTLRGQADSDGWLAAEDVSILPETCRVEWGWPSESPAEGESATGADSEFVFELDIFVKVAESDPAQATKRRLHNLRDAHEDDLGKAAEQLKKDQHLAQSADPSEAERLFKQWHDGVNPEPRRFEGDAPSD